MGDDTSRLFTSAFIAFGCSTSARYKFKVDICLKATDLVSCI